MGKRRPVYSILLTFIILFSPLSVALGSETTWPIVPNGKLGQFQHGTYPSKGDRTHAGVDIIAPCGSPVYALTDGTVIDTVTSPADPDYKSLGYMVLIDHEPELIGKAFYSIYLHLQDPPLVHLWTRVTRGTIVGKVESTGAAEGCHVHFEIRYFSSRFSPLWKNIYGPGDQRASEHFKSQWENPSTFVQRFDELRRAHKAASLEEFSRKIRSGLEKAARERYKALENAVRQRLETFLQKHRVTDLLSCRTLTTNPYAFEGKMVAVYGRFGQMVARDKGVFATGPVALSGCPFAVSSIPRGTFSTHEVDVVVAGEVLGHTEVKAEAVTLQVPHLKFVGLYVCEQNYCNDILPPK